MSCALCNRESGTESSKWHRCHREGCEKVMCGPCTEASRHMYFTSENVGRQACSALCRANVSYMEKREYRIFHDGWCACGDIIRNDAKYYDEIGRFSRIVFVDDELPPTVPDSIAHTIRIDGQTVYNIMDYRDEFERYRPKRSSLLDKLDKSDPGYPAFLEKYNAIINLSKLKEHVYALGDEIMTTAQLDVTEENLKIVKGDDLQ